jgi:hypothetical protein
MATLDFGVVSKTSEDYIKQIQEVLGVECPISVSVINGVLKHVSVETEWKTGGTNPVETGEFVKIQVETEDLDEEGNPIIVEVDSDVPELDYVEDYEYHELTPEQLEILNTWVSENVEA